MLLNEAKRGMKSEKSRLAIFDTFKTKTQQITGEASRPCKEQSYIIYQIQRIPHQKRELPYLKALQRK